MCSNDRVMSCNGARERLHNSRQPVKSLVSIHYTHSVKQKPRLSPGLSLILIGRLPTLPHTRACSTIGAEGLNFRVRDGNGWDPFARITQNRRPEPPRTAAIPALNIDGPLFFESCTTLTLCTLHDRPLSRPCLLCVIHSKFYGQAERAISNGQLNALLHLHICPINVVVCHGSY